MKVFFNVNEASAEAEYDENTNKIKVYKGAKLNYSKKGGNLEKEDESALKIRDDIIKNKRDKDGYLNEDIEFSSPTQAAKVLLGYRNSGPDLFVDEKGVPINKLSSKHGYYAMRYNMNKNDEVKDWKKKFFDDKCIYAGWNVGDLRKYEDIKQLKDKVNTPQRLKMINLFRNLKKGDYILLQTSFRTSGKDNKNITRVFAIGEIEKDFEEKGGYEYIEGIGHKRPVKWLKVWKDGKEFKDGSLQDTIIDLNTDKRIAYIDFINEELKNGKEDIIEKEYVDLKYYDDYLYYGAPGCGKSYEVKKIVENETIFDGGYERVLFYPEYTYSDFIGQILPETDKENKSIRLSFKAGPFTRILSKAYKNKDKKYCLVIEEINRGNAAAIFGDIFQLMDRRKKSEKNEDGYREGDSEYKITNLDIVKWIKETENVTNKALDEGKIYLPNNLYIYATMNTTDQNVFILDTAFKRRWNMKYVEINFENNDEYNFDTLRIPIKNSNILWKEFVEKINEYIPNINNGLNGDDKLIGPYFVSKKLLVEENDTNEEIDIKIEKFAQKIFMYLWNDVVKTDRHILFRKDINSYNMLIKKYKEEGIKIFEDNIISLFEDKENNNSEVDDTNEQN